jgi:hypothetical protein
MAIPEKELPYIHVSHSQSAPGDKNKNLESNSGRPTRGLANILLELPSTLYRSPFHDSEPCVCAMTRLRATSPGWPEGSGAVLRPKSCVRKIFLPPYLIASYFCSSDYNRLVVLRHESPFFWESLKRRCQPRGRVTTYYVAPCASCTSDVQVPPRWGDPWVGRCQRNSAQDPKF